MKDNYEKILEEVFKHEGGYVDHPSDPGGATNMGITRKVLAAWRKVSPYTKLPKSEVKNLSKQEAAAIYRKNYWNVIKGDSLPSGIDAAVMDYGVNSGPVRSVIHLQEVLGVAQDGKIGPITIEAAAKADPVKVVNALMDRREKFLKSLSTFPVFGRGWMRRTASVRAFSLSLIRATPVERASTDTLVSIIIRLLLALFGRK